MHGAVKRCGQVVVAMVAAGALSVSSAGAVAEAAAPPAVTPDQAAEAAAPKDKGPGAKPPRGAPYEKQTEKLKAAASVKQSGPKKAEKVEVPAARTATTRTMRDTVTGVLTTELSSESVHYEDAKGAWKAVDNDLVPAPGGKAKGWVNAANRFTATFPADLGAGPVRVADTANPERFVSLELADDAAAGTPATSTPTAGPTAATPTPPGAPTAADPETSQSTRRCSRKRRLPAGHRWVRRR